MARLESIRTRKTAWSFQKMYRFRSRLEICTYTQNNCNNLNFPSKRTSGKRNFACTQGLQQIKTNAQIQTPNVEFFAVVQPRISLFCDAMMRQWIIGPFVSWRRTFNGPYVLGPLETSLSTDAGSGPRRTEFREARLTQTVNYR